MSGKTTTRGHGRKKKGAQEGQQEGGAEEPGVMFCRMLERKWVRGVLEWDWPVGGGGGGVQDKLGDKWAPEQCLGAQGRR